MLLSIRPPTRAAVKGVLVPQLNLAGNMPSLTAASTLPNTTLLSTSSSLPLSPSLLQQQQQQQQVPLAPRVLPPEMAHIY